MANVTIYTTPTCGYCKMAKQFFQENNVEYTEADVTTDPTLAMESVQKSGQNGVPVIDVDGKIIVGYQPDVLAEMLGLKT